MFDLDGKLVSTFEGKNENHFANFLAAVRSRKREDQNAEILEGHQSSCAVPHRQHFLAARAKLLRQPRFAPN